MNIFKAFFCATLFQLFLTYFGQAQNTEYLYNQAGKKILYNTIDNVIHIGFEQGMSFANKNEVLENLSSIADYDLLPDNSYRFTINQDHIIVFKKKLCTLNNLVYSQHEYKDAFGGVVWPTNRLIVKMKNENSIDNLFSSIDYPILRYESKWYDSTIYTLIIPKDSNIFTLSNRIYESGLVDYAQPSFHRYSVLDGYETNPKFVNQWNIRDTTMFDTGDTTLCRLGTNVVRAWEFTTGSPNIKVAILDNGVEGTHEDLTNNFLLERNYTDREPEYMENARSHGTSCAGIISAVNNNTGIIGIAHNCKIASFITQYQLPQRDENPSTEIGIYDDELVADAIYYACDSMHTHIYSCSWHRDGYVEEILKSAINHATQHGRNGKGCIFVFSSGNNYNSDNNVKPTAILPNVLSVGATSATGYRASWDGPEGEIVSYFWESCYGDSLDLMAPGELVWTTCNLSDSCYGGGFEGTSAAAPHVAGVAALVLSMDTNLTYRQVFEILCSSAKKVRPEYYTYSNNPSYPYGTWNNEMGYGLVNAHHAILKTLYRDYYITGPSSIGLCQTGSFHLHGTTPFNDTITNCWTSSPNIEILSTTDPIVARGTMPGSGWIAFNIIHDNDSLALYFPIAVTNGQFTVLANHEISNNTTLSTPYFVNADLIIDSLATLTVTDTLYIAGGHRIIVRPGGKLIVNGGTLTNACDGEMWQGIVVEGNANIRQAALAQGSVISPTPPSRTPERPSALEEQTQSLCSRIPAASSRPPTPCSATTAAPWSSSPTRTTPPAAPSPTPPPTSPAAPSPSTMTTCSPTTTPPSRNMSPSTR